MITSHSIFLELEMFQTKVVEKIKTHTLVSMTIFFENRAVCEIVWKNVVGLQKPQTAIYQGACALHAPHLRLQTHTICNTHCLLQERASMLRHTHIAWLVHNTEWRSRYRLDTTVNRLPSAADKVFTKSSHMRSFIAVLSITAATHYPCRCRFLCD